MSSPEIVLSVRKLAKTFVKPFTGRKVEAVPLPSSQRRPPPA